MKRTHFRKEFLPKDYNERLCLLFTIIFIPISFLFEMCVVLPSCHGRGSLLYMIAWIIGLFYIINIAGNMIYCILEDTSIKPILLTPPTHPDLLRYWRYCSQCEVLAPPRSWHCDICRTCILKRDHHCLFLATCIGHRNLRYFIILLIHIFLGTLHAFIYNSYYIWWLNADIYMNAHTVIRLICPFLVFLTQLTLPNIYLAIYELNTVVMLYSITLLCFHGPNLLRGSVLNEHFTSRFDMGWKRNLQMVFGERWHLALILPFVNSELPHNGINWEQWIQNSLKNL